MSSNNCIYYNNPYSSTRKGRAPETIDDFLKLLETTVSPDQLYVFFQQSTPQLASSEKWNLSHAIRLVDWILQRFENQLCSGINEGSSRLHIAILGLLSNCIEIWDDRIVYATVVHQTNDQRNDRTFLEYLEHTCLVMSNDHQDLCLAALVALTRAWEALDRLHQATTCLSVENSLDAVWWIPAMGTSLEWENVLALALKCSGVQCDRASSRLQECFFDSKDIGNVPGNASSTPLEEAKGSCLSFLAQLLQHDQTDWIYFCSDEVLDEFTEKLSAEALRLLDINMPASSYTELSLISLQLWISLNQVRGMSLSDLDWQSQRGDVGGRLKVLIGPILQVAFGNSLHATSCNDFRWAHPSQQTSCTIKKLAQSVIHAMCVSSQFVFLQEWVDTETDYIRKCAESDWADLTRHFQDHDETVPDAVGFNLFTFHRSFHSASRDALARALESQTGTTERADAMRRVLMNLLRIIHAKDSLWAAGLLSSLLNDRRKLGRHNGVSRDIWSAIDARFVSQMIEQCVARKGHSAASDFHGPKTLSLMDCLLVVMTMNPSLKQSVLSLFSADAMESFVSTMCPKSIRVETANDHALEESTPPAHNLSRVTDTSLCIEEEKKSPRGMDEVIRIATASFLATLGTRTEEALKDGHTLLLQQRICEAVHSFVSDSRFAITNHIGTRISKEMTLRRIRLLAAFSHPEHEDLLSMAVSSVENGQTQLVQGIRQRLERSSSELKASRKREQELKARQDLTERRLSQQTRQHELEKHDLEKKLTFESKKQIAIHWEERAKAEQKLSVLSANIAEMQLKEKEANSLLQQSRASEERARTQLNESSRKLVELQARELDLCGRMDTSEKELIRVTAELESTKSEHQTALNNEKQLLERFHQQGEAIVAAEQSEDAIRESLESLFADMVSLARLYELKEKEVSSSGECGAAVVEELQRKIKDEKARNSEMQERLEQVKYENDVLSKKYARSRERLERERKERQRGTALRKRSGNMSYIGQLNQSEVSERSSKSNLRGKENESYRSVSSKRRSRSSAYT